MKVRSLSKSPVHNFSKENCNSLTFIEGLGIEGDAHKGIKTQHLYQMKHTPDKPNLRQVHLIHEELFAELARKGIQLSAGQMGENITTSGIDLLSLARHTILKIGNSVELEITGLRNPCRQLNDLHPGLMQAVLEKGSEGAVLRKAGVMSIVSKGGEIKVGDSIEILLPEGDYIGLEPV